MSGELLLCPFVQVRKRKHELLYGAQTHLKIHNKAEPDECNSWSQQNH